MGFGDVMLNIATLGAHGRVKNEVEYYESLLETLNELNDEHEKRKQEVNSVLAEVIEVKKETILLMKKSLPILKNPGMKQRDLSNKELVKEGYSLEKIEASITAGDMAISATKGTVAGVSTALGAWALVGTYGAASTGTAISALSGVTATNAALAWFGGGSLAVGGGGIAAGTLVVGGLVAVPLIAITGLFQHLAANKKIKQLEEEELKILGYVDSIKENLVHFDEIELRSKEVIDSLRKSLEAYQYEYKIVYKKIYPFGLFSKTVKWIRKKIFKRHYYSDEEYKYVRDLGITAESILKIVETPIF